MVFKEYFVKKQQAYHCRPLKPHTVSNQPWPLVALKGSKMVNPGLAQVIQHKGICHTIIDLCSSENHLPSQNPTPQSQDPESKLKTPKSKMQRYLKEKLFETNYCIFGYLWGPCHPWPVVALVGSKMVNPWFSRNISQKNNKHTTVDP